MDAEVDVAVVGGGPAGAAAAHFLARAGRSVVVLEQKRFPREKTCGDGLTPRAIGVLEEMGLGEQLRGWHRVRGMRFWGAGTSRSVDMPATSRWCDYGVVVPRRVLDAAVLERAAAAGAQVRDGTKVTEAIVEDGAVRGVVARSGDREHVVRARRVVCAEGAAGTIRRQLGHAHRSDHPMGLALRQYCEAGPEPLEWFDVHLDLREPWGLLPGYGWAFPVGDGSVNVGMGLLHTPHDGARVNLHRHLDRVTARLAEQGVVAPRTTAWGRRGGRLFMGGGVWPPQGRGYVLVGDAAGRINPATGEGIAYAYESGRLAAAHVHQALEAGDDHLAAYSQELQRTYGGYYRLGRGLAALMTNPVRMEQLVRQLLASDRRMRFASTLLLNLDDPARRSLDQHGLRSLSWLARATPWQPRLKAPPATADRSTETVMP